MVISIRRVGGQLYSWVALYQGRRVAADKAHTWEQANVDAIKAMEMMMGC